MKISEFKKIVLEVIKEEKEKDYTKADEQENELELSDIAQTELFKVLRTSKDKSECIEKLKDIDDIDKKDLDKYIFKLAKMYVSDKY